MNYLNNNAISETNETKLIIESKEFTLIKYSCGDNDKWFCEELGIMIVKQEKLDKTISWQSMYDRETEQLKKLIGAGEDEVAKWKNKVEKLPNAISDEYIYYNTRLQRAENGLQELKKLSLSSIAKSNQE